MPSDRRPQSSPERLRRQLQRERRLRENAETALRQLQDRFNIFLDHAPMPAFIRDGQGRHVYANKPWAKQFDRPLAELIGKTNWDLFPRETALVFEASDQAAWLSGEMSGLLESGLAPDGVRRWWKVFKFPLPGTDGDVWIGGLALDVTDLVQAHSRLGQFEADLAKGRLVADVNAGNAAAVNDLPPRLSQMLALLTAGWTVKQIAARLGISPRTAEVHRTRLLRRLGVDSVVEAVRLKLTAPGDANPAVIAARSSNPVTSPPGLPRSG